MTLRRVQLWHFGCDYVDPDLRRCWASRSETGGSRVEAIATVQADGWSVSRRRGWDDVRCALHRGRRATVVPTEDEGVEPPSADPEGFPARPAPAVPTARAQRRRERRAK